MTQNRDQRVTTIFQKYGYYERSHLGLLGGGELGVAVQHHGQVLHDEPEYLGGLTEVCAHVDEAIDEGGEKGHQEGPRGLIPAAAVFEVVTEAPDGAHCGDSDGVRLVLLEATHGALKEGGDGGRGQV